DVGPAIVVRVARGKREPAVEHTSEGRDAAQELTGGAEDLDLGTPAGGTAGDDLRDAVAAQVRRGQGDSAGVFAAECVEAANDGTGRPIDDLDAAAMPRFRCDEDVGRTVDCDLALRHVEPDAAVRPVGLDDECGRAVRVFHDELRMVHEELVYL